MTNLLSRVYVFLAKVLTWQVNIVFQMNYFIKNKIFSNTARSAKLIYGEPKQKVDNLSWTLFTSQILDRFFIKLDEVVFEDFLFLVDGFHRLQVIVGCINI